MSELGSGPYLFWVLSLLSAAALGLVIGLLRAWWLASLGLVVPGGLVIASQFLSNDTLPGAEDL